MPTYLLLQNGPDMGVGGVGGESEDRPGQGVRQRNGGDECFFCRGVGGCNYDASTPSKSNKQISPFVRGADPRVLIRTKMSRIRNTELFKARSSRV